MSQEELGKNEEEMQEPSSAELSQSETADTELDPVSESGATAEETPTSNPIANNDAAESTDSTDDDVPAGDAGADQDEDDGADVDDTDLKYKRGQVYSGTVTQTNPTAVFVDLGDGTEGIVPGRELELMTRKMLESLKLGAQVDVYVVNPRNHRGEIILSINHALEELDWRKAIEYGDTKEVFDARIGGYNKGGLIVRFGRLRGFVPQSQIADERTREMSGETPEERYGPMVNQPVSVKVMEVDRSRNRLILSERAAMREVRQRRKEALIEELKVGETRTGIVVSLENFGAFVDIGGAEGLIHLTELAWRHITHPRQVLKVGEEVEVEVISIDPDQNRIGLSRKRTLSDPWDEIATAFSRGQLVRGTITKLTKFGAFAKLVDAPAVEGLIHISELSDERVEHPKEVVKKGDRLALRVVKIDVKNRRLGLSLKAVNSTEYLDLDWEMAIAESENLPAGEIPLPVDDYEEVDDLIESEDAPELDSEDQEVSDDSPEIDTGEERAISPTDTVEIDEVEIFKDDE